MDVTNELVGSMFTTAKELRHLAEQQYGDLFVPTEVLTQDDHSAVLRLHPDHRGALTVHAERECHWHPFRVTRVDAAA